MNQLKKQQKKFWDWWKSRRFYKTRAIHNVFFGWYVRLCGRWIYKKSRRIGINTFFSFMVASVIPSFLWAIFPFIDIRAYQIIITFPILLIGFTWVHYWLHRSFARRRKQYRELHKEYTKAMDTAYFRVLGEIIEIITVKLKSIPLNKEEQEGALDGIAVCKGKSLKELQTIFWESKEYFASTTSISRLYSQAYLMHQEIILTTMIQFVMVFKLKIMTGKKDILKQKKKQVNPSLN